MRHLNLIAIFFVIFACDETASFEKGSEQNFEKSHDFADDDGTRGDPESIDHESVDEPIAIGGMFLSKVSVKRVDDGFQIALSITDKAGNQVPVDPINIENSAYQNEKKLKVEKAGGPSSTIVLLLSEVDESLPVRIFASFKHNGVTYHISETFKDLDKVGPIDGKDEREDLQDRMPVTVGSEEEEVEEEEVEEEEVEEEEVEEHSSTIFEKIVVGDRNFRGNRACSEAERTLMRSDSQKYFEHTFEIKEKSDIIVSLWDVCGIAKDPDSPNILTLTDEQGNLVSEYMLTGNRNLEEKGEVNLTFSQLSSQKYFLKITAGIAHNKNGVNLDDFFIGRMTLDIKVSDR